MNFSFLKLCTFKNKGINHFGLQIVITLWHYSSQGHEHVKVLDSSPLFKHLFFWTTGKTGFQKTGYFFTSTIYTSFRVGIPDWSLLLWIRLLDKWPFNSLVELLLYRITVKYFILFFLLSHYLQKIKEHSKLKIKTLSNF